MAFRAVFDTSNHHNPIAVSATFQPSKILVSSSSLLDGQSYHNVGSDSPVGMELLSILPRFVQVKTRFDKVVVKLSPLPVDFSFGFTGCFVLGGISAL